MADLALVSTADPNSTWFAAARLLRPQGRRGEILADPLTDQLQLFTSEFCFRLTAEGGGSPDGGRVTTVLDCWQPHGRNAGRIVLRFAGIESIAAAEELEGQTLWLPEANLPPLDEGVFFVRDLLGCRLFNGDTFLGEVTDLQFAVAPDGKTRIPDAADLLVVTPASAVETTEPVLVPFVKAWLQTVDLEMRRIVMRLPEGLLE